MKIAFTTLACPNWSWDKILQESVNLGYDGIEIRGIEGEMNIARCKPFLPENLDRTKKELKDRGIEICCLDTSCVFHSPEQFDQAVQEGIAAIDTAQQLEVPYIRVFGDAVPNNSNKEETIERVARGLKILVQHAEKTNVHVLLETHGDFADISNILSVLHQVEHTRLGVLWDINNPYKYETGESMADTHTKLKPYIKHTHIKDTLGRGEEMQIKLVGEGDVPVNECISLLREHGYNGWLSFEWEKKWHPSIEEPEIALKQFMDFINNAPEY